MNDGNCYKGGNFSIVLRIRPKKWLWQGGSAASIVFQKRLSLVCIPKSTEKKLGLVPLLTLQRG